MDPNGGRLVPECAIYIIWRHLGRVAWVQMEVGWRRSALYQVFDAAGGGLGDSKWILNGLRIGWASTVPSQALKQPGALQLEVATSLVATSGFMFALLNN